MRYSIPGSLVLIGLSLTIPCALADISEIARGCNECHGADGVSSEGDVPTIAGMSAFVIEDYLLTYQDRARPCHETRYRSGDTERPATNMCDIADQLADDEPTAIAEYYSDKMFVPAEQEFDAAKAEAGASIHRRDCEKCHTDNASNADDDAGVMAGQWMPYLRQVFEDFASGEREMVEDKMREKFADLSAEDKDKLIHFYGSLQ
jgi:sulfide dehydrogenase cytochrome subunit